MNKHMKKIILLMVLASTLCTAEMSHSEAAPPSPIQFEAMSDGNYINWKHKTMVEDMTLHDKNGNKEVSSHQEPSRDPWLQH